MLEVVVVETYKQHARVGVIQSLHAGITTIGVETIVVPNMDIVKRGILIRYVAKLGTESGGVLVGRNLSRSSTLPTTIGVVGKP